MKHLPVVAYFSMEIALESEMPNYAGGLGVLAADTLLSAADMDEPVVGITLLYHQDDDAEQAFDPSRFLIRRKETVAVAIEDRVVNVVIWEKRVTGRSGKSVPVFFLSTNHPKNEQWDRDLTKHLYANDRYTRLGQEIVLGIGGVRALEKLGYSKVIAHHLNEGHAALATFELLRMNGYDKEAVRSLVTFTTHTPVPAGHDYFEYDLVQNTLREMVPLDIRDLVGQDKLGMTELAMHLSKSTNSVSLRHKAVCEQMFPGHEIRNVTNGIYAPRWIGEHMEQLFDTYLPGWDEEPSALRAAPERLPDEDLAQARLDEERELVDWINQNHGYFAASNVTEDDLLDTGALTIGFARRTVPYKRTDLIFRDLERLAAIGERRIQLIFAGRCHSGDTYCNELRARIRASAERLRGKVRIVLLPEYDTAIAKRLVAGCDVWLNNPVPPQEASGTSGMKAALNGALNLSLNDGWWPEALARDAESGWGFGGEIYGTPEEQDEKDSAALYDALAQCVECYYERGDEWLERMKHAIALVGHFNTNRVVAEYRDTIWNT